MEFEPERFEATDEAVGDSGAVPSIEAVGARIAVFDAVAEHVAGGREQGSRDGPDRLPCAPTAFEAQELGPQVAVVLAR